MCGIGGFYRGSEGEIPLDLINTLWCSLEDRGTHASGIVVGWKDSDKPLAKKNDKKSSLNRKMLELASGKNTEYVLLHTRYTTQGSTKNNGNNHPVVGHGITLTHNGVLSNDDYVFKQLKVNRLHDVDTEAINAALSVMSPKWMIENIRGSMSLAWVETNKSPDEVHLLTNGQNPLVIGRTVDNHVVWASTKTHLEESGFEFSNIFSALPYKQYTISSGGRISSTWISDKRANPMNPRHIHSSQRYDYWDDFDWEGYIRPKKKKRRSKQPSKAQKQQKLVNVTELVEIPQDMMTLVQEFMDDYGYDLAYDSYGNKRFVDRWVK